eukprot:TRINITY_DN58752_c0_g2_i2.p1 TRINITY_DN58752_c0_g2~~TRINITY_DN58752_c0_g2_i2.p1  ORF type:complete len:820 (-),score=225.59 TRINITY_DN58752_c0_g2_i2:370-2829(-)
MATAVATPVCVPLIPSRRRLHSTLNQWGGLDDGISADVPPYELSQDMVADEQALAAFRDDRWLSIIAAHEQQQRRRSPGLRPTAKSAPPVPPGYPPPSGPATLEPPLQQRWVPQAAFSSDAPLLDHRFERVTDPRLQDIIRSLLTPSSSGSAPTDSLAKMFSRSLQKFVRNAFDFRTKERGFTEEEWRNFVGETTEVVRRLVRHGKIQVACERRDLFYCIEAFAASCKEPRNRCGWTVRCLETLLDAMLQAAPQEEREVFRQDLEHYWQSDGDLYPLVDVRAWPTILRLAGASAEALQLNFVREQIELQLLLGSQMLTKRNGLEEAAELVGKLGAHLVYTGEGDIEHFCQIFNQRLLFEWDFRQSTIQVALSNATRTFRRRILQELDKKIEVQDRHDDEYKIVRSLLVAMQEDIRVCPHAFYKMKTDWLVGENGWGGVIGNEELSAQQVFDHIVDDREENFDDVLKKVVNKYVDLGRGKGRYQEANQLRLFDAGWILAQQESKETNVFATYRNDKELTYIVGLFQEEERLEDKLAPLEEEALVVPCDEVVLIDHAGHELELLEQETLGTTEVIVTAGGPEPEQATAPKPRCIGVSWRWRCLDPHLDFWPRAAYVCLVYEGRRVVFDLEAPAMVNDSDSELAMKDVLVRILKAEHLLKVVHSVDAHALKILQRALMPDYILHGDSEATLPEISPVLDMAVTLAMVRHVHVGNLQAVKLSTAVWDFLRVELCMQESLSNFQRRPLRKSQQHYILSLAYAPLLLLRVFCAYEILTPRHVFYQLMRLGYEGQPTSWDKQLSRMSFGMNDTEDAGRVPEAKEAQ